MITIQLKFCISLQTQAPSLKSKTLTTRDSQSNPSNHTHTHTGWYTSDAHLCVFVYKVCFTLVCYV